MKKLLIAAVAALMSVGGANAQRIGITGGLNGAEVKAEYSNSDEDDDLGSAPNFNVGIKADFSLKKTKLGGFFLEGALLYSRLGYETDITVYNIETITTEKYSYLQLPIHFGHNFDITNKFAIAPKAGIYFGGALGGEYKQEVNDKTVTDDVDPFKDGEDNGGENYKRFDFGAGVGVNFEFFKHLQLCLGYQWGFVNFNQNIGVDKWQNRNFHLNVAYMF